MHLELSEFNQLYFQGSFTAVCIIWQITFAAKFCTQILIQ